MDGNRFLSLASFALIIFLARIMDAQGSGMAEGWVARYDGPAGADDEACAIAVDDAGNVYVTGSSTGNGSGFDYATVEYDSSGTEQWVARYDGPGNAVDSPVGIALDGSGNVYVAGTSAGSGTGDDFALVKYDSDGNEQWVARYNGPGNGTDHCVAVAVTPSGNICVTGWSQGSGSVTDYATVCYDSGGDPLWVSRYDDPDHGQDNACAMGVDGAGNVYVTGTSDSEEGNDFVTVKYDHSGDQQWVVRFVSESWGEAFAVAIAVDPSGYSYVAGEEMTSYGPYVAYEYATVAYSPAGVERWRTGYVAGLFVDVKDIALGGTDAVFVTGTRDGSPYSYSDYNTVRYSSDGVLQWSQGYDGPGGDPDTAEDITADEAGDSWVTGSYGSDSTGLDYASIGYDPSGVLQWIVSYDGPGHGDDVSYGCAVDGSWNVYVTGASMGSGSGSDFATVRYEPSTGIGGSGEDLAFSLACCPSPSTGTLWVSVSLTEPSDCSIQVFGMDGRLVDTVFDGSLSATGLHRFTWIASDRPAGVYFVRAATSSDQSVSRVVLLR